MIENIIFDFGGVFINLDPLSVNRGLRSYGLEGPDETLLALSKRYEKGEVSSKAFIEGVMQALPGSAEEEVRRIWNGTIADFPPERLDFLCDLHRSGRYRMFLLSNTNALHIEAVREKMGIAAFTRFYDCFEKFYLSHEIGMRKPDPEIFSFVLETNGLQPGQTLFIDDTREHTESARRLGIRTWHLDIGKESILELPERIN
jgi:putative hydrolase of the HAD superfamily